MSKKLIQYLASQVDMSDCPYKYEAWKAGVSDPIIGDFVKDIPKGLFNELRKFGYKASDYRNCPGPISQRALNAERKIKEYAPQLNDVCYTRPYIYNGIGKVNKISDAFIKGLGNFDFVKVMQGLKRRYELRLSLIRVSGYFGHGDYREYYFENKKALTYLVRYWNQLKNFEHHDALVQNLREAILYKIPLNRPPSEFIKGIGCSREFDWLKDASIEGFKVLKNQDDLKAEGERFDNCLGGYAPSIMRRHVIVVTNEYGCAEYSRRGLIQCSGYSNGKIDTSAFEAITEDVLKLF
jgi:hypothetical protein